MNSIIALLASFVKHYGVGLPLLGSWYIITYMAEVIQNVQIERAAEQYSEAIDAAIENPGDFGAVKTAMRRASLNLYHLRVLDELGFTNKDNDTTVSLLRLSRVLGGVSTPEGFDAVNAMDYFSKQFVQDALVRMQKFGIAKGAKPEKLQESISKIKAELSE